MPRRTYLHTAEWKYRRTLVSLSASSRRRNRDAAPPQPRVDRRPTTRLHIRHQFYSLLTVSGHPCAGKLLNHPQIRTKASLVTAPLSIRASFLPRFFKYIFYFFTKVSTADEETAVISKGKKKKTEEEKAKIAVMWDPKETGIKKKKNTHNTDLKIAHRQRLSQDSVCWTPCQSCVFTVSTCCSAIFPK